MDRRKRLKDKSEENQCAADFYIKERLLLRTFSFNYAYLKGLAVF